VSVGDVFAKLDQQIKAKKLKGISDISQFYADPIHMNKTGSYVIALTFYATMYKQSPVGAGVPSNFGTINSTLAGEIQSTVWNVVTHNAYSGVNQSVPFPPGYAPSALAPEPMTLALCVIPMLMRRRR